MLSYCLAAHGSSLTCGPNPFSENVALTPIMNLFLSSRHDAFLIFKLLFYLNAFLIVKTNEGGDPLMFNKLKAF